MSYDERALQALDDAVCAAPHVARKPPAERWVIFDNTGAGLAVPNARRLQALLGIEQGAWV